MLCYIFEVQISKQCYLGVKKKVLILVQRYSTSWFLNIKIKLILLFDAWSHMDGAM